MEKRLKYLLSQYRQSRQPQIAIQIANILTSITPKRPDETVIEDMQVANVSFADIEEAYEYSEEKTGQIWDWLALNASFSHSSAPEHIIYIGYDNFSDVLQGPAFYENHPPKELINIMEEAHSQGYKYICFYVG